MFKEQTGLLRYSSECLLPFGIRCLIDCQETPPSGLTLTLLQLDDIADHLNLDKHWALVCDGDYSYSFLAHVEWWIKVARSLVFGRNLAVSFGVQTAEVQAFREGLPQMAHEVTARYSGGVSAFPEFAGCDNRVKVQAALEMIRHYRFFTRYISSFAVKLWPDVDLAWLVNQR